ncbi:hypothetical protein ACTL6P_08555 [Endozoicomonas acroporae]|uniref:hypothetical protein n=1 Tax=Endozoicomonas acroporae TaxID=1701104 RepID=UPI000C78BCAE|nr:hypothetical protein [Endozoicomonas acroporae]
MNLSKVQTGTRETPQAYLSRQLLTRGNQHPSLAVNAKYRKTVTVLNGCKALKSGLLMHYRNRVSINLHGGTYRISHDYYLSDLSKTQHQAVFMACDMTSDESVYSCGKIEQFLNVIQKIDI